MPAISKYRVGPESPIGKVLVINIQTFKGDPSGGKTRHGSEQDVESLKSAFKHLHFDNPTIKTDLTKSQIIEAVKEFVRDLNKAPVDICSVCIMSHGDKDYLMSHDNEEVSPEKDILEMFSNSNCPTMKGRPKMFLFQFCRGKDRETQRDYASPSSPTVRYISTLRDAIIAYSTVPGFVSYRDRGSGPPSLNGSWFIQAFCKVCEKVDTTMKVQELFKLVSQDLSDRVTSNGQEKQTMEVTYRSFEKDLFFKTASTTNASAMLSDSTSPPPVLPNSTQQNDSSMKGYNKTKRNYRGAKAALEKRIREIENRDFKNKNQTKLMSTELNESITKVNKTWEEVGEKMDEDGDPEGKEGDWYIEESSTKDGLVFKGKETCYHLDTLFDVDDPNEGLVVFKRIPSTSELSGAPTPSSEVLRQIESTLSSVTVSKKSLLEFEEKFADKLIQNWEEDSQCKIFTGILKSKYEEFLDRFQETTGIDDKVKATFKTVALGKGGVKDNIKYFKCEGVGLTGKYGMYACLTRPDPDTSSKEDLVDIAYSVFTFKTDLVEVLVKQEEKLTHKSTRTKAFNCKRQTVVKDVADYQRLKVKDINFLAENFILAKALKGFQDAGVIPVVRYEEDALSSVEAQGAQAMQ